MEHVRSDKSPKSPYPGLPAYLEEPPGTSRRTLRQWGNEVAATLHPGPSVPARPTVPPAVPFGGHTPALAPTFSRMVTLHRDLLPAALASWWAASEKAGSVRVHHRLQLKPPEGDIAAGWRMQGRVRRLTTLHWTPVVVELWPRHDDFIIMTMTPQRPVLATKRYFRLGHTVLDHLWADLAARETSSR